MALFPQGVGKRSGIVFELSLDNYPVDRRKAGKEVEEISLVVKDFTIRSRHGGARLILEFGLSQDQVARMCRRVVQKLVELELLNEPLEMRDVMYRL